MPIYEYKCPDCGNEEEAIIPFSESDAPRNCSNCGKPTARRLSVPQPPIVPTTAKGHILETLNHEKGKGVQASPRDRPRIEAALAKGLDQQRPVVGVGI